jgi:hypothetical protein
MVNCGYSCYLLLVLLIVNSNRGTCISYSSFEHMNYIRVFQRWRCVVIYLCEFHQSHLYRHRDYLWLGFGFLKPLIYSHLREVTWRTVGEPARFTLWAVPSLWWPLFAVSRQDPAQTQALKTKSGMFLAHCEFTNSFVLLYKRIFRRVGDYLLILILLYSYDQRKYNPIISQKMFEHSQCIETMF